MCRIKSENCNILAGCGIQSEKNLIVKTQGVELSGCGIKCEGTVSGGRRTHMWFANVYLQIEALQKIHTNTRNEKEAYILCSLLFKSFCRKVFIEMFTLCRTLKETLSAYFHGVH